MNNKNLLKRITSVTLAFIFFIVLIANEIKAQTNKKSISKDEKAFFIEKVSKLLVNNYVFPEVAAQIEKYIKSQHSNGAYEKISDLKEFADLMTKEVQSISKDKHMRVRMMPPKQADDMNAQNPIMQFYNFKSKASEKNYGMAKVEKTDENIGILEISSFNSPVELAKNSIDAAMNLLAGSDAIIIDVRRNPGGSPEMVNYVCSYFFDKPTHINSIYSRKNNKTTDFVTFEKVDGPKMIDVPIFILTSNFTFSGAEEFCYDMQNQKRATIIGEITGGGANPGGLIPVSNDLGIFIPTGKAINPITKTNWEGVGIIPEIKIEASKAFETALVKAREAAKEYKEKRKKEIEKFLSDFENTLDKAEKLLNENKNDEADKCIENHFNKGIQLGLFDEFLINGMGYEKMRTNISLAISIFKFNAKTYKNSANTYDSLGEAYMNADKKDLAIESYEKALKINPELPSAIEALKKLKNN